MCKTVYKGVHLRLWFCAVWWCVQPRPHVRLDIGRDSLWQRPQPWTLHQYRQKSRHVGPVWRRHCRCEFDSSDVFLILPCIVIIIIIIIIVITQQFIGSIMFQIISDDSGVNIFFVQKFELSEVWFAVHSTLAGCHRLVNKTVMQQNWV